MLGFGAGAELPNEIAQVLPVDPYAQLEVAQKIMAYAYSQKVAAAEAEAQQLREAVIGKQNTIKSLERRVSMLETEVQDWQSKAKAAAEESHRLSTEKGALIDTVKRLNREVAKLESFKKSLMQHLQDDDEPAKLDRSLAAVDLSSERLVADVLSAVKPAGGGMNGAGSGGMGGGLHSAHTATGWSSGSGRAAASTPYSHGPTPTLSGRSMGGGYGSPTRTPAAPASNSPPSGGYGSVSGSGRDTGVSGAGFGSVSGSGSSPKIDGKEFFRQARARLSYEQFSSFLSAIKDLNSGRATREETLRRAQAIFGPPHADMFSLFEGLLSKHMTTF